MPWEPHRPLPAGTGSVVNRCGGGWSAVVGQTRRSPPCVDIPIAGSSCTATVIVFSPAVRPNVLPHRLPYTNSTFTRRPTIAAARCKLPSVMSFFGSSSRSTWVRLVFSSVAILFLEMFCCFMASASASASGRTPCGGQPQGKPWTRPRTRGSCPRIPAAWGRGSPRGRRWKSLGAPAGGSPGVCPRTRGSCPRIPAARGRGSPRPAVESGTLVYLPLHQPRRPAQVVAADARPGGPRLRLPSIDGSRGVPGGLTGRAPPSSTVRQPLLPAFDFEHRDCRSGRGLSRRPPPREPGPDAVPVTEHLVIRPNAALPWTRSPWRRPRN